MRDEEDILDKLTGIYFRKCYFGMGEVTDEEEEYINQEIICIPTGKNGYDFDQEQIKEYLEIGKEYTLDHMNVGQSSGELYLNKVPGVGFNTVCFDYKIAK